MSYDIWPGKQITKCQQYIFDFTLLQFSLYEQILRQHGTICLFTFRIVVHDYSPKFLNPLLISVYGWLSWVYLLSTDVRPCLKLLSPFLDLHSSYCIIAKPQLKVLDVLSLSLTKHLAKHDAISLLDTFGKEAWKRISSESARHILTLGVTSGDRGGVSARIFSFFHRRGGVINHSKYFVLTPLILAGQSKIE